MNTSHLESWKGRTHPDASRQTRVGASGQHIDSTGQGEAGQPASYK